MNVNSSLGMLYVDVLGNLYRLR